MTNNKANLAEDRISSFERCILILINIEDRARQERGEKESLAH